MIYISYVSILIRSMIVSTYRSVYKYRFQVILFETSSKYFFFLHPYESPRLHRETLKRKLCYEKSYLIDSDRRFERWNARSSRVSRFSREN